MTDVSAMTVRGVSDGLATLTAAQTDALSVWPEGQSLPTTGLLWGLGGMGLMLAGWLGWRAARRGWKAMRPLRLFRQVARSVGLTHGECWTLWRASRQCGLHTPLTLMICRATLDHYRRRLGDEARPGRALAMDRTLQRVAEKLFGDEQDASDRTPTGPGSHAGRSPSSG